MGFEGRKDDGRKPRLTDRRTQVQTDGLTNASPGRRRDGGKGSLDAGRDIKSLQWRFRVTTQRSLGVMTLVNVTTFVMTLGLITLAMILGGP